MINPQITVLRFPSEKDWTLSEFYINGVKKGVGIEDEYRDVKVFGETRIPNGMYEIDLTPSPKFSSSYYSDVNGNISEKKDFRFINQHLLITLKKVPNFERVLWHWGNTDKDTNGCYLVGSYFGTKDGRKAVLESRKKYKEIYPLIYQIIVNNKNKGLKTFVEYKDK